MKKIIYDRAYCSSEKCDMKDKCNRHISHYNYDEKKDTRLTWILATDCIKSKLQFPYALFEPLEENQ